MKAVRESDSESFADDNGKRKGIWRMWSVRGLLVELFTVAFVILLINYPPIAFQNRYQTVPQFTQLSFLQDMAQKVDQGMFYQLLDAFKGKHIVEFGARDGRYGFLMTQKFANMKIRWWGFDSVPRIEELSQGKVEFARPKGLKHREWSHPIHWIMCLNAREHFSPHQDKDFIEWVANSASLGLVISGADDQLIKALVKRFEYRRHFSNALRKASDQKINRDTIHVFIQPRIADHKKRHLF